MRRKQSRSGGTKLPRRIVSFLSVIGIVRSSFLWERAHSNQAIREVLRSAAREDVIIRIQERYLDDGMRRLLEVVSDAVIGTWPTQILVSARLQATSRPTTVASSRTLLIYLCPSAETLDYGQLRVVLQETRLLSQPKQLPRLLLVCASKSATNSSSALQQLKYLWHLRLFNVVILEMSLPPRPSEPALVAAHVYDGFVQRYARLTASHDLVGVDWFPDKPRNMHGARLWVAFKATALYGSWKPIGARLEGLAEDFAEAMSRLVNATVLPSGNPSESDLLYDARLLLHSKGYSASYEHTVSVGHDEVCLLLPLLPQPRMLIDLTQVVMSLVIGFLIIAIVWSASVTLSVGDQLRAPLNIISQILCIPPMNVAHSTVERIMFVTVMLSTAEYANVFHAELFRFNVQYTGHARVSSFWDLYKTGLKVLVPPVVYETKRTIGALERLPAAFLRRFQPSLELDGDPATLDTDQAYFMPETSGKLAELTKLDGRGERLFKVYDLCVMYLYRVHTLPVRSPYKSVVDGVLLALAEHGFTSKHLRDFWERRGARRTRDRGGITIRDYSKYIAIIAVFTGCLLSLLVFLGELIVGLFSARGRALRVLKVDEEIGRT
ncbi:hypothetical protein EAI_12556 [Harpegnathos saltator]|uniref:Ionotropic glutamate receptor L-glutamate and glycine-binding domain-containing protein n=1 Tax=Harpegnathos saltator TaxID=610380 RepID=E2BDX1_HARSA|nr:hypothetical protein EAI_12556 [Harpegnathos saltator]